MRQYNKKECSKEYGKNDKQTHTHTIKRTLKPSQCERAKNQDYKLYTWIVQYNIHSINFFFALQKYIGGLVR